MFVSVARSCTACIARLTSRIGVVVVVVSVAGIVDLGVLAIVVGRLADLCQCFRRVQC